jgi:DNA modification methylase
MRNTMDNFELYCDDCFDWLERQPDCSIHGVITDPPFAVVEFQESQLEKMARGQGGVWRVPPSLGGHLRSPLPRFTVYSDAELGELCTFFEGFGRALMPKLVPGAHMFVAATTQLSHLVFSSLSRAGLERRGEIVRLVRTLRGGDRPKNAHDELGTLGALPAASRRSGPGQP